MNFPYKLMRHACATYLIISSCHCPGAAHRRFAFNTNLAYGSESAVDALPPNKAGFHDSFGNVWQWMEDHMSALSGFKVDPLYDDFTMPCFDGEVSKLGGLI